MRRRLLLVWLALGVVSLAQVPAEPSDPAGTVELWVRPLEPLSTDTAKPGQVVTFELWQEARLADGSIFLPKGARLFGALILVEARSQSGEARLALYVMRAEWKGGSAMLNAFLAGPVCRPQAKPGAGLLAVDRNLVRWVRGPAVEASRKHAHIRLAGDPTYGVAFVSRSQDIRLPSDVVFPLRHIPVKMFERTARRSARQ